MVAPLHDSTTERVQQLQARLEELQQTINTKEYVAEGARMAQVV